MTIAKEGRSGPYIAECDSCHDTEQLEAVGNVEARNEIRDMGWRSQLDEEGYYQHFCKDC